MRHLIRRAPVTRFWFALATVLFLPKFCYANLAPPVIAASVAPYIFVVDAISGGELKCVPIVPEGNDPHTFSPTLAQTTELARARVWLLIGEPFEAKCIDLVGGIDKAAILDLRTTCPLLPSPCSCGHANHHHEPQALDLMDTHLWLSPRRLIAQSRAIERVLSQQFPDLSALFQRNLPNLISQLNDLDAQLHKCTAALAQRAILVSHPALTYFCDDYQLDQLSAETEGKDPTPQQQSKLLRTIRMRQIDRIFIFKPHSERASLQLAELHGLKIVTLDPYHRNPCRTLEQICIGLRS